MPPIQHQGENSFWRWLLGGYFWPTKQECNFLWCQECCVKEKGQTNKIQPSLCSSSTKLSPAILHLAATWLILTHAVQNEVFQHMLMLQTTFKSFFFCCNIEPKQTLKSQKLQQNSFVIPPASFNPHPGGAWWQNHRYTQGCTSPISSCSFTHWATRSL